MMLKVSAKHKIEASIPVIPTWLQWTKSYLTDLKDYSDLHRLAFINLELLLWLYVFDSSMRAVTKA